jgi:methylmalonyl-CoA/ethylmalonyl-CoA epimerase
MTDNNETAPAVPIIDHVGIAVNSLDEAVPRWAAILGQEPSGTESVDSEQVRIAFFGHRAFGRIELLEPTAPTSSIARHLATRGAGIHHVCLRVTDLDEALRKAGTAGVSPIPPAVRRGASGARIAFFHPRATGGILIELREAGGD